MEVERNILRLECLTVDAHKLFRAGGPRRQHHVIKLLPRLPRAQVKVVHVLQKLRHEEKLWGQLKGEENQQSFPQGMERKETNLLNINH